MDERLRTLQAETEEEQTLRRKRDSLEVEYRSLCSYERELAVLRQKGQEDVARMEQGGRTESLYESDRKIWRSAGTGAGRSR